MKGTSHHHAVWAQLQNMLAEKKEGIVGDQGSSNGGEKVNLFHVVCNFMAILTN